MLDRHRPFTAVCSVLLFSTLLSACLGVRAPSNLGNHQDFRGESALEQDQAQWFREVRINDWERLGVEKSTVREVLAKIDNQKELRDYPNVSGSGGWTVEFSQEAERKLKTAQSYRDFREVSALFLIAAYPNYLSDAEHKAIKQSVDAYLKAEQLNPKLNVELVSMPSESGDSITGLLHLPITPYTPPVVLMTGGVDKILTEHRPDIERYIEQGFAVITFDIPGAGLNRSSFIKIGHEAMAHTAAYNYVQTDSRLDKNKVGALSSSGGGVPLMHFAIQNPDLKAIVARCAVVNNVLLEPEVFHYAPRMSAMSYGYRIGVKDIEDLDSYGDYSIPLALSSRGYTQHEFDTPLLVINTKDDMVVEPKEMQFTANLSTQSEIAYYGEEGHCPDGEEAEKHMVDFFSKWLM